MHPSITKSHSQKLRFLLVGGVAFGIDLGVFASLSFYFGIDTHVSRVVAFVIAVLVTCVGNRLLTFSDRDHIQLHKQYIKAIVAGIVSLCPNLLLFTLLLSLLPAHIVSTVIAFGFGTSAGIVTNYLLSSQFVFRQDSSCSLPH
ncbi:GtrA family protein [Alteromonas lipotrueiana]|uniref:GtrA family protein n=1 Tax=Alteromonas lipotrueiana TaxID=2803815 RepID=UPI001C443D3C